MRIETIWKLWNVGPNVGGIINKNNHESQNLKSDGEQIVGPSIIGRSPEPPLEVVVLELWTGPLLKASVMSNSAAVMESCEYNSRHKFKNIKSIETSLQDDVGDIFYGLTAG